MGAIRGFLKISYEFLAVILHVAFTSASAVFLYPWFQNNRLSASALVDLDEEVKENAEPRAFSKIPGPLALPFLGSQWLYMWPGPYSLDKLHLANQDKYLRYGPIVKENHLWNFPIIHLYDKRDIEEVLKYPSKFPIRPELEAQCVYRRSCPERYSSVGLVNAQGVEWHHLRSKLLPHLIKPSIADYTIKEMCSITDELIQKIKKDTSFDNTLYNFEKLIYRFGLEVTVALLLNQRLGTLKDEIPPVASRLMEATDKLFEVSHETLYGLPWWKYFPSSSFNDLKNCEDTIYEVFAEFVHNAREKSEPQDNPSFIDHFLAAENVDERDKIVTLIDLVAAGIETTGNATIFLLHNILSNSHVKARVYEELDEILPSPGTDITVDNLLQLTYLRACVTESMRLSPVAPNVARVLEKPFIFQNYSVPASTLVICETWVACLQESNYLNADKFIPERWLEEKKTNPFLVVPFGAGRRMCPGKRIAEQEILTLTAKLLQQFDMEFSKPVEQIYKFLISPKGPIKISVSQRNSKFNA